MSVSVRDRQESYYDILNKALGLASYTVKICCNEKIFLPKYQNALTNDIVRDAKDIYLLCFASNNIRKDSHEAYKRIEMQKEACVICNRLLSQIYIAQRTFHLSKRRVEYWSKFVIELRNHIRKWYDSERRDVGYAERAPQVEQ